MSELVIEEGFDWLTTVEIASSTILNGISLIVVALTILIIYKLLRTPTETDPANLYLDVFPRARWVDQASKPKRRRVALLTYGTRGDVQPLVALAQELSKRQIETIICTADSFQSFIVSNGCAFASCGVAVVEQPAFLFDPAKAKSFAEVLQVVADVYPKLAEGMWNSCAEFQPDVILSQAVVRGIGAQCAEKLKIPHWVVHFAPSNTPTIEFPPAEYGQSKFGFWNKLKYTHRNIEIAKAAVKTGLSKSDELFRKKILGLPGPLDPLVLVRDMEREPSIHAYSPVLQPKPSDWASWNLIVGAFTFEKKPTTMPKNLTLDQSLEAFLSAELERKPVYIGFGSMEGAERQFTAAVRCVALDMKLRVVICTDMDPDRLRKEVLGRDVGEQVKIIRSAPHELLFPRCSVAVHHGGAGTTNAAIEAGIPQVVMPILAWSDQPFWGNVVQRMGVGFRVNLPANSNNTDVLQSCIQSCLEDEIIQEKALALKFAKHPNGAIKVADLIDRYFGEYY